MGIVWPAMEVTLGGHASKRPFRTFAPQSGSSRGHSHSPFLASFTLGLGAPLGPKLGHSGGDGGFPDSLVDGPCSKCMVVRLCRATLCAGNVPFGHGPCDHQRIGEVGTHCRLGGRLIYALRPSLVSIEVSCAQTPRRTASIVVTDMVLQTVASPNRRARSAPACLRGEPRDPIHSESDCSFEQVCVCVCCCQGAAQLPHSARPEAPVAWEVPHGQASHLRSGVMGVRRHGRGGLEHSCIVALASWV